MNNDPHSTLASATSSEPFAYDLLSKEHPITEKGMMEFQPFGILPSGEKIQDQSGVTVRGHVEFLEEVVSHAKGPEAGKHAVQELVRLMNERISDPAYHVTAAFLKNPWNSYSYEAVTYLSAFAGMLSQDPRYHIRYGREKFILPIIRTLGRPFSIPQIYKTFAYFGEKYARGSIFFETVSVNESSAILRIKFTDSVYRQFGKYRKACVANICEVAKGAIAAIPEAVHHLKPATVKDRTCIVNGDEYCEWEFHWEPQTSRLSPWVVAGSLSMLLAFIGLRWGCPWMSVIEAVMLSLLPAGSVWLSYLRVATKRESNTRESIIQEQMRSVESKHEELREAYMQQQQTTVELQRKVNQLTTVHETSIIINSALDRNVLLDNVLTSIVTDLQYDLAMVAFYDPDRHVLGDVRIVGASKDIMAFARTIEVPVTTPPCLESEVILHETHILVKDIQDVWIRLHPIDRQLFALTGAKSFISVPLKTKKRILGAITVQRIRPEALTQDDVEVVTTVAGQLAVALDNAEAYGKIEALSIGLEAMVRERTTELEQAVKKLKEMDEVKSLFLAHVSHELRTPLTSISGFIDNMLNGLTGPLSQRQGEYLTRIQSNGERLARMIADLLDRARIEAGKLELALSEVNLPNVVSEAVDQLRPLARAKQQRLDVRTRTDEITVWGDADKIHQIVTNLVDNAIKYTPEGGVISVQTQPESSLRARVSVRDTGPGIPSDALPKLFDPFFRIGLQGKTHVKGLGLGLSIVKDLVELHGGDVSVCNAEKTGAEFHFTLPCRQKKEGRRWDVSERKRVLVVDDDFDIRRLLVDRLSAKGYLLEEAGDGRAALEILEHGTMDGLILDLGLPIIDGLDVLHRIGEMPHQLSVMVITAGESKERALLAMRAGAHAYLLKPFNVEVLSQIVDGWFTTATASGK
jgi:signal transduction histidine kinase